MFSKNGACSAHVIFCAKWANVKVYRCNGKITVGFCISFDEAEEWLMASGPLCTDSSLYVISRHANPVPLYLNSMPQRVWS
jgi:hypothetical protein